MATWNPKDVNAIQWALDAGVNADPYEDVLIGGLPVLRALNDYDSIRAARGKRCYNFDGVDDHVELPGKQLVGGDFSIVTRVLITANTGGALNSFFTNGDAGNGALIYLAQKRLAASNPLQVEFWTDTGGAIYSDGQLANDQWYDIVATYEAAGSPKSKLYVDGVLQADTSDVAANFTGDMSRWGRSLTGSGPLAGKLQFGVLYDKALTQNEVNFLLTGVGDDPGVPGIGQWDFNEEDGTDAFDSSGNGQDGVITNATLSTFQAVDDAVDANPANSVGHSLANTLTFTAADGSYVNDACRYSVQVLAADTEVLMSAVHSGQTLVTQWGFTTRTHPDSQQFTFGVYFANFDLYGMDGEVFTGQLGTLVAGDEVRIVKTGATIQMLLNGVPVHTYAAAWDQDFYVAVTGLNAGTISRVYVDRTGGWILHSTVNATEIVIPQDASAPTKDVLGGDLQYPGQCSFNMLVETPVGTFDGVDDYVSVAGTANAISETMSYGGWFYASTSAQNSGLVGKWVNSQWGLNYQGSQFKYTVRNGADDDLDYVIDVNDEWHHVAVTQNGTSRILYLDGVEVAADTSPMPASDGSTLVQIGKFGSVWPLAGGAADVGVWLRTLTPTEVLDWSNGVIPSPASLEFYSTFAEGDVSVVYDVSGNDNHGTILNATLNDFWANRTNVAKDHGIVYGGRNKAGEFVPGLLDGSAAADGNPLDLTPGNFCNPASRLLYDYWTAPELATLLLPAQSVVGELLRNVAPIDQKYRSEENAIEGSDGTAFADGDNRVFNVLSALTGGDLDAAILYIGRGPTFLAAWANHATQIITTVAQ